MPHLATWYRREDYDCILAIMDDAEEFPNSFEEWVQTAWRQVAAARSRGAVIEQDGRKYIVGYHPAVRYYRDDLAAKVHEDFALLKREVERLPLRAPGLGLRSDDMGSSFERDFPLLGRGEFLHPFLALFAPTFRSRRQRT